MRRDFEYLLNIWSHIELLEHFITLVEDKELDILEVKGLSPDKSQNSTWSSNNDLGRLFWEEFFLLVDAWASIDDCSLDSCEILIESLEFFFDLISELTCVA